MESGRDPTNRVGAYQAVVGCREVEGSSSIILHYRGYGEDNCISHQTCAQIVSPTSAASGPGYHANVPDDPPGLIFSNVYTRGMQCIVR